MIDFFLHLWTVLYSVFLALFLFGITIFVHEFGHFIIARRCGLIIKTFSIGFGRALFQWEKDGILYKIGWIPFGGYVALPQLDPAGMEKIQSEGTEKSYPEISPWKKIIVAASGPIGNILFAIILAWVVFLGSNQPIIEETAAKIGMVDKDSQAYQKGIRSGDIITAVNGISVHTWTDFLIEGFLSETDNRIELTLQTSNRTKRVQLKTANPQKTGQLIQGIHQAIPCLLGVITKGSAAEKAGLCANDTVLEFARIPVIDWQHFTELVQNAPDKKTSIQVEREGQNISLFITPTYDNEYDRVMVGVSLGTFRIRPMDQLKNDSTMIFRTLKGLVTPKESRKVAKNLQGPIGIFSLLIKGIKMGPLVTLGIIRLININLAILNLLPIPVLDGGHILFALWQGITRRKINAKAHAALINLFALLLIGVMLILFWTDIKRNCHIKDWFNNSFTGQTEQAP